MKGRLTEQYHSTLSGSGLRRLPRLLGRSFSFLRDVFRDQKVGELTSFVVWEARHRLRLFPRSRYLRFTDAEVLRLEDEEVDALDTSASSQRYWAHRALRISPAGQDWKTLLDRGDQELLGALYTDPTTLYRSRDGGRSITRLGAFPGSIEALYVDRDGTIFVCVPGALYRSGDDGESFQMSLELQTPESSFRRSVGMTETPEHTLIIGEYGNVRNGRAWLSVANLYVSSDGGSTWERVDYLKHRGANKHVHFVWYSDLLNRILVADGDNKKRLWISDPVETGVTGLPRLNLVNRFHIQMGGHTSVTESGGRVLLGTDYMGGTNFLLDTNDCRAFNKRIVPDPYRKSPIMQLQPRRSRVGIEIWALLPYSSSSSRCVLMYSRDHGAHWTRAVEYGGHHGVQLIGSSTEVPDVLYVSVSDRQQGTRTVYVLGDP